MALKRGTDRPNVNDRRIINGGEADVVQLYPMKHTWAWDFYNKGNANHWLPQEISMQIDIEQWKSDKILTQDEKNAFETALGFFTTADSIAANNIVLATYRHITSPEVRMYLLRQAYEEAIHTHAYQYIVESLGLDSGKVFNMYRENVAIFDKASFILGFNEGIFDPNFKTGTFENDQKFLENLCVFSLILEGIFFYSSFAVMFGFLRQNKMVGSAEQIQYIMRDESLHLNFGLQVIKTIIEENPSLWTTEFKNKIIGYVMEAVELESAYAKSVFPNGIFGMNAKGFHQYIQYVADRRLDRVGLPKQYNVENPFPWMGEASDISKEKNFFETKVTEYQNAGVLDW